MDDWKEFLRIEKAAEAARIKLMELTGSSYEAPFRDAYGLGHKPGEVLGGHEEWHNHRDARKTYVTFHEDGTWEIQEGGRIPAGKYYKATICIVTLRGDFSRREADTEKSFRKVVLEPMAKAFKEAYEKEKENTK